MKKSFTIFILLICISLASIHCRKASSKPGGGSNTDTNSTSKTDTNKVLYSLDKFCMGADLSFANQLQDFGAVFKDSGIVKDPFIIFRQHGCNLVRVRLWHTPGWTIPLSPGKNKMYSDLNDVAKTIKRAKDAGMAVNLDFHYSDTWADPSKQALPQAWTSVDTISVLDSVYNYTYGVISYLNSKGLIPEMVQIGNEINPGMLFPFGQIETAGWANLGKILNKGIKAVRDATSGTTIKPQIILHIAQPENVQWWFDHVTTDGNVHDFDILGLSYYVKWSSVSLAQLPVYLNTFKTRYQKKVMIVETAYSWTPNGNDNYGNIFGSNDKDPNYPQTPQGQLQYMKSLVQTLISAKGSGIMYWEPDWISSNISDQWGTGSPWENNAFFDFSGNALPVFDFMSSKYNWPGAR